MYKSCIRINWTERYIKKTEKEFKEDLVAFSDKQLNRIHTNYPYIREFVEKERLNFGDEIHYEYIIVDYKSNAFKKVGYLYNKCSCFLEKINIKLKKEYVEKWIEEKPKKLQVENTYIKKRKIKLIYDGNDSLLTEYLATLTEGVTEELKKKVLTKVYLFHATKKEKYPERFQEYLFYSIRAKMWIGDEFWNFEILKEGGEVKKTKRDKNKVEELWNFTGIQFHKNTFKLTKEEHMRQSYGDLIQIIFIEGTKLSIGGDGRHRPFIANYFNCVTDNIKSNLSISGNEYINCIEEYFLVKNVEEKFIDLLIKLKKYEEKLIEIETDEDYESKYRGILLNSVAIYYYIQSIVYELELIEKEESYELAIIKFINSLKEIIEEKRNSFPFIYMPVVNYVEKYANTINNKKIIEYLELNLKILKKLHKRHEKQLQNTKS